MARKRFCTKNSLRCSHKSFGIAHRKANWGKQKERKLEDHRYEVKTCSRFVSGIVFMYKIKVNFAAGKIHFIGISGAKVCNLH